MQNRSRWLNIHLTITLLNFIIAGVMGLFLRYAFIGETSFNFSFLLHAHSHTAALGWAYQAFYLAYVYYFVKDILPFHTWLFWITQISVVGMMISFPLQGYGSFSIPFSALHVLCSYVFIFHFFKNSSCRNDSDKIILNWSLIFLFISTLGIWMLGPSMVIAGKGSAWYQFAIQWYLHFQFSGWFIFASVLLTRQVFSANLTKHNFLFSSTLQIHLFALTVISGITLIMHVLFHAQLFYLIHITSNVLLLMTLILMIKNMISFAPELQSKSNLVKWIIYIITISLVIKLILEILTTIPKLEKLAFGLRHFTIGYIHLVMLGVASLALIHFIHQQIQNNGRNKIAVLLFLVGGVGTIFLLFLQGYLLWQHGVIIPAWQWLLFSCGFLILLSLIMYLISLVHGLLTKD
ncbi:MAG: hypothetical protein IPH66_14000 [Crocinitomicaceae bacterium]|nr:hypothetical protein [Crocinitomicaceae bacterium]